MPIVDPDNRVLNDLQTLISERFPGGAELRIDRTELPLIFPAGSPAAYTVNEEGQVTGFKLGKQLLSPP